MDKATGLLPIDVAQISIFDAYFFGNSLVGLCFNFQIAQTHRFIFSCSDFQSVEFPILMRVIHLVFGRVEIKRSVRAKLFTLNVLQTEKKAYLPELVIIEVKKSAYSSSPALRILSALRIKPARMSKYCMGVALTDEAVKHNKIKEKIKLINKITPINYESV